MADQNDLSKPPETLPAGDKPHDETSKLRTFLSILRKFIGVSDMAAVRFSLPAQLMEPIPNLEYWHYLDRPETFAGIGKSDDDLGRMLEVLRFWFTKDLKYIKGKPCKPYNSALGEFFRCNWEVEDDLPPIRTTSGSVSADDPSAAHGKVKISYLTEQTSHHPPVSAFYVDCPARGVVARGYDQISAKFTGTSVRVSPGQHNLGIFVNLARRDNEEYRLTHPDAHLGGLLRGALSISVADSCFVTCPRTRIKTILTYLPDGWLSAAQHKVTGVVFRYDPAADDKTRIKDVPEEDILARIDGCWQGRIYYTLAASDARELLMDVVPLFPVPKDVPALERQLPNESRRYWAGVTDAILAREYALATKRKQELEENKRREAAERKAGGGEWAPRFFTGSVDSSGKPELTEEGRRVLADLHAERFGVSQGEAGAVIENPAAGVATAKDGGGV